MTWKQIGRRGRTLVGFLGLFGDCFGPREVRALLGVHVKGPLASWLTPPRLTISEGIAIYARWFICVRWIVVMLAAMLACASVSVFQWLPQDVWWPLLIAVGTLAGLNVLYLLALRRKLGLSVLLPVQAFLDVGLFTVVLHFSGGVENPLSMVVVIHVIIGGILLSRTQCYGIAAAASGLFTLMAVGEWAGILKHHTLALSPSVEQGGELVDLAYCSLYVFGTMAFQAVVLFLTAYFVTTLVERMRSDERHLEVLAGQAVAGQRLLEQALETTGTGLRVLNGNLEADWSNGRWKEWFDLARGSASLTARFLNGESSPARRCREDGQGRVTELVLAPQGPCLPQASRTGAGQRVVQVTTAPLKDADGTIQQIAEVAEDVTELRAAQTRMMRADKLAAVGQLAGQMAHEINNPMTIISGKARLLLADYGQETSPAIAQELTKIAEAAERVARIAQGLLSFSRPSRTGRLRLDVRVPIRKSLAMIEEPARRRGVVIQDSLSSAGPPVYANSGELEQVFLNLFLNARDAMEQGGTLQVRAWQGDSGVHVEVADTGLGIPPEHLQRIYDPFFTTKQEGRGTGLGLCVCQGIIRSHGGEIAVESEPGQGARFLVKLPIAAPADPVQDGQHD